MNKTIKTGVTLLVFIFSFCFSSTAQSKENIQKKTVVKSSKTTDPNYQKNLEKSKKTQASLDKNSETIVKDDKYYITNINLLKDQIKKIETTPNTEGVNPDKLENLKLELEILEKEYFEYKNRI